MDVAPSPRQREAIEAPLGPVLVVAGPGAGKTFCLIARIEYLIERIGIPPERICAVTFTNKAADEIATRLRRTLGERADAVTRGTIHALCLEMLRPNSEAVGLRPGFGVADEDYQRTIVRRLGQDRRAGQLINLFGRRRLQGYALTPGDEQLYRGYVTELRRRNMADFDDLIMLTAELFTSRPEVADALASRWDYLLVDEFQDVNPTQYAILERLASPHGNIFAVGDDEQSIFAFTGADPRVLQSFRERHGIAEPIVLERNHRCSTRIFDTARRLLAENPTLFDKEIRAVRESAHPVRALAFDDDESEADWLIEDIQGDHAENVDLAWGDFAVLYRRHEIGERLESRLIRGGVPCRLAKGRPLTEDPVVGYVIAALRLVHDPRDPVAAETFARRVLPPHLMERVQASVASTGEHFLLAVREVAMELGKDPDAKKLWRLVYQVENLAGLRHAHHSLAALVWDVLSQRIGPYRNVLEERHEDLSDPLAVPEARVLAERLQSALKARSRVLLQPMAGLEIALRGLLFEGGLRLVRYAEEVDQVEFDDLILGGDAAGPDGLALTMFKALQLVQARDLGGAPERYVTFDLETTDLDPAECDLVDIAAVRVERGRITETFQSLVRPGRPVSSGARRIHGYTDADLADAPHLEEVWPRFRAFVGGDTLVAHNGQKFDVPVLRRLAAPLGGADDLVVFDTLPLAHSLSGDSAKLGDLAARFGVDTGRSHRALDDARTLVGVYEELERRRVVRSRKSLLVNLLSYLGLSLALDGAHRSGGEAGLLFELSRIHALGRYSDCLDFYAAERERRGEPAPSVEELVRRLGGERLRERLREEPDPARRFPNAVARLQSLMDQDDREPLEAALDRFLERVALSTSQGAEVDPERVNLLTLHSTKGLEFSRVYVVGVEDEQLPGFVGRDDDPEEHLRESRRLLYVGMTRARERLLLTRVDRRNDKPSGGSRFLDEMGLALERPGRSPAGDEVPEEPALEESDLPRFEGFG